MMKPVSISRLFVEGRPDEYPVALRGGEIVTWRTVAASVASLSCEIARSSSRRWVLSCRDALDFLLALFAVWHARRLPIVPVNFQTERICDNSACSGEVISGVPLVHDISAAASLSMLDPLTTRLVLQTSGSTGTPKSIEKTVFQLDAEVSILEMQWGACLKDASVIATVPHYHIYGLLFRLLWPIAAGRPFVVEELSMPDDIQSLTCTYAPAAFISSPSHLDRMPDLVDLQAMAPHVVHIFSSGAPLSPATAMRYVRAMRFAPTEVLGSTETGGIAWREGGEMWTPFPDVSVRLAPDDALEVRSPRTHEQKWHVTGDRAAFDGGQNFRLVGRLDRIAKIEGKRVCLEDIEKRLNSHELVDRAGVIALEGGRTVLGAALELSGEGRLYLGGHGRSSLIAELKAHLSRWFEPVVIPKQWRFVSALPVSDRGKITASALASLFERSRLS